MGWQTLASPPRGGNGGGVFFSMIPLREKIGYGFGDMASSMFWKVLSYYLPFFYSNIFGLEFNDAAMLFLVTRIWDAVSDPVMGTIADRTRTRWGKYRPYLLWVAAPFAICGVLVFTTPGWEYGAKLFWAYFTYILMMTVYTGINVPYGAMLGVITDDSNQKTVLSSYRMFFAYGGSFIALASWEPLSNFFANQVFGAPGQPDAAAGNQWAMICIASVCFVLFLCCFAFTKERIKSVSTVSVGNDLKALVVNAPWWLMIGAALCTNLFNTVRGSTVAYFFADIVAPGGAEVNLLLFGVQILFYSGLFLSVGEVANMVGVSLTVPITKVLGKKGTFIWVNFALVVLSIAFFFVPVNQVGFWIMLLLQIVISICTGIISPLIWSMYADVSDYAELKYNTASTGLIFSSSSMAQKFGSAFGGAAVMWILGMFGYVTNLAPGQVQPEQAINCLWWLMSWIPAIVAGVAMFVAAFYPLNTKRMREIEQQLRQVRINNGV